MAQQEPKNQNLDIFDYEDVIEILHENIPMLGMLQEMINQGLHDTACDILYETENKIAFQIDGNTITVDRDVEQIKSVLRNIIVKLLFN